ncbi:DNA primase [Nitrospira tepida]|uniref:DNA primase n=1 Tax=Nitrospira tepida TaxID=2973512 RepID=A0AA86MXJ4_9BACT|nr:DNA primase [Nitrospira tepida]CAI4030853.1 DNA primase [Nitrospira tepida]
MSRGPISDAILAQIKERLDIIDVVSGHMTLTRTGQNFKACCPFHDDRTPSFTVSPGKQLFHCFGCGASGDAIAFFMKVSGLTFPEAMRELGRRVGVQVPETSAAETDQDAQRRRRLEAVNQAAAAHFRHTLSEPAIGKPGRDYLESRGIDQVVADQFGLGYAAPDWERLVRSLMKDGFSEAEICEAGLAVPRNSGARAQGAGSYDQFRGRVIFPITDLRRRVVGFGGRVVGPGEPKYLNSRDTPLFKKGQTLYALDAAYEAAGRQQTLIIVEGYFDVIALHQAGIRTAVATLGTALTPEHVRTVRRYAKQVVLLFDPDAAGVRAALRTLNLFVDTGLAVNVVSLPDGHDPDTFVRAHGAEGFGRLLEQAPSLWDFALDQSLRRAVSGRIEEKVRAADAVVEIIQKISHPVEKAERLRQAAERLGINEQRLAERYLSVERAGRATRRPSFHAAAPVLQKNINPEERELIHLLLQGQCSSKDLGRLRPDSFVDPATRAIAEAALRHRGADGRLLLRPLLDELLGVDSTRVLAAELSVKERHDEDAQASIRGCLEKLDRRRHERLLAELVAQLKEASQAGRTDEVRTLNERVNELRLQKAAYR